MSAVDLKLSLMSPLPTLYSVDEGKGLTVRQKGLEIAKFLASKTGTSLEPRPVPNLNNNLCPFPGLCCSQPFRVTRATSFNLHSHLPKNLKGLLHRGPTDSFFLPESFDV